MTDLNMGALTSINWPALDEALRAALPGKLDGTTYAKGVLIVHVLDGVDAESLRPAIAAVIAAHNPAVLSAAQQEAVAQTAARTQLTQADFNQWKADFANASTLVAIKPLVWQLARLVWMIAKAHGLVTSNDPGA